MNDRIQSSNENDLLVVTPPGLSAEWDWILSVVLEDWLGLSFQREEETDAKHVSIALRSSEERATPLVLGADFWLAQTMQTGSFCCPTEPLQSWMPEVQEQQVALVERQIPVLFGSIPGADIPIDVFGSAFWMLARVEELAKGALDNHGRFPASRSLAMREGFLDRPIIDEYRCLLIDGSLSDQIHAQHQDSNDRDFDKEHRIGGLGIDSKLFFICVFFGVSIFDLGGVRGSIAMW